MPAQWEPHEGVEVGLVHHHAARRTLRQRQRVAHHQHRKGRDAPVQVRRRDDDLVAPVGRAKKVRGVAERGQDVALTAQLVNHRHVVLDLVGAVHVYIKTQVPDARGWHPVELPGRFLPPVLCLQPCVRVTDREADRVAERVQHVDTL